MDDETVVMQPSHPCTTDDAAAPSELPTPAAAAAVEVSGLGADDEEFRAFDSRPSDGAAEHSSAATVAPRGGTSAVESEAAVEPGEPGGQCASSVVSAPAAAEEDPSLCGGSCSSTAADAAQPTVQHEEGVPAAAAPPPRATSWEGSSSSDFGDFGDAPMPSAEQQPSSEAAAAHLAGAAQPEAADAQLSDSGGGVGSNDDEEEEEEDDDGFGAWDDGAASSPAPAAATTAAPVPPVPPNGDNTAAAAAAAGGDLLTLPPGEFQAAAASLLSCLLPGHGQRGPSAASGDSSSHSSSTFLLPTFASLEAAHPALAAWGAAAAPAAVLGQWHGSRSEARLLQRMGLAPSVAPLPPASTASLALQQALSRTSVALPMALAAPAPPPPSAVLDRSAAEAPPAESPPAAAPIAAAEAAAAPRAAALGPPVRHISCDDPFAEMAQQETSDSSASGRAATVPIAAPGTAAGATQAPYSHSTGPSGLGGGDGGGGGEAVDESAAVAVPEVVAEAEGWGYFAAMPGQAEEPGSEPAVGSGWDDGGDVFSAAQPTVPAPAAVLPPPGATLPQHATRDQDALQPSSAAEHLDPTWGEGVGSLDAGSAGASAVAGGSQEREGHTAAAAAAAAAAGGTLGWAEEGEEDDDDFADFAAAAAPAVPLPATLEHAATAAAAATAAVKGTYVVADEPLPAAVAAMPVDEVVAGAGPFGNGEEDGFSGFAEAAPAAAAVTEVGAAGGDPLPPPEALTAAAAAVVGGAAAAPPSSRGMEPHEGAEPALSGVAAKAAAALAAQLDDLSFMLSSTILPIQPA